jgi:hypothetical protein
MGNGNDRTLYHGKRENYIRHNTVNEKSLLDHLIQYSTPSAFWLLT